MPKPKPAPIISQNSRLNMSSAGTVDAAEPAGGAARPRGERKRLDHRVGEREVRQSRRGVDGGADRLGSTEEAVDALELEVGVADGDPHLLHHGNRLVANFLDGGAQLRERAVE